MRRIFFGSRTSVKVRGNGIPGALARHGGIPGFNQDRFSRTHVACIGAGGLMSNIAPMLCRKGIGALTIVDDDVVEASNLNRQRFYPRDIGKNKAEALVRNLRGECTFATRLTGYPLRLQEAIASGLLACDIAVCGVDNNPARTCASRFFREVGIPIILTAVSRDDDYGYVFVQEREGACIGCLFPDSINDDRYPCPGTPAIADILQAVGSLAAYAVDSLITDRPRAWNYRTVSLSDGTHDASCRISRRAGCALCSDTPRVLR